MHERTAQEIDNRYQEVLIKHSDEVREAAEQLYQVRWQMETKDVMREARDFYNAQES
jgi:hypothetical protein